MTDATYNIEDPNLLDYTLPRFLFQGAIHVSDCWMIVALVSSEEAMKIKCCANPRKYRRIVHWLAIVGPRKGFVSALYPAAEF